MADTQPPMAHEDSIDEQDPNLREEIAKQKSRRPASEKIYDDLHIKGRWS